MAGQYVARPLVRIALGVDADVPDTQLRQLPKVTVSDLGSLSPPSWVPTYIAISSQNYEFLQVV